MWKLVECIVRETAVIHVPLSDQQWLFSCDAHRVSLCYYRLCKKMCHATTQCCTWTTVQERPNIVIELKFPWSQTLKNTTTQPPIFILSWLGITCTPLEPWWVDTFSDAMWVWLWTGSSYQRSANTRPWGRTGARRLETLLNHRWWRQLQSLWNSPMTSCSLLHTHKHTYPHTQKAPFSSTLLLWCTRKQIKS